MHDGVDHLPLDQQGRNAREPEEHQVFPRETDFVDDRAGQRGQHHADQGAAEDALGVSPCVSCPVTGTDVQTGQHERHEREQCVE
ncbi:MAG: hypothetical protein E6H78_20820 [Betaproteobacteria bacterium]|nr:MAG: hypothetical protein E6H78_20820 [Betaproteobacteria bacterium]